MLRNLVLPLLLIIIPTISFSQAIDLKLVMPQEIFHPGDECFLLLSVESSSYEYIDLDAVVALTFDGSEFWFFPNWVKYPSEVDSYPFSIDPSLRGTIIEVIPEFKWPSGVGNFTGAQFLATVFNNGKLVSNVAEHTFDWTDEPASPPTPTPTAVDGMVFIPAGSYYRGSPDGEMCKEIYTTLNETRHYVTLTRSFYVMETEVSRQMWADLRSVKPGLPEDPSRIDYSPTLDHPVQMVSWFEAILFANLLSEVDEFSPCYFEDSAYSVPIGTGNIPVMTVYCDMDSNGYRLPTDAEWEYATRAGTEGPFFSYEPNLTEDHCRMCDESPELKILNSIAWWCGNDDDVIHQVGTKEHNPWGLYDVHGNVAEWGWSRLIMHPGHYLVDPDEGSSDTWDPRVVRGGSRSPISGIRSSSRYGESPYTRETCIGFRLVRTVE